MGPEKDKTQQQDKAQDPVSLSDAVCKLANVDNLDAIRKVVIGNSTDSNKGYIDTRAKDGEPDKISSTSKEIHRGLIRIGDCFVQLKRGARLEGGELSLNDIKPENITSVFIIDEANGKQKFHAGKIQSDNSQEVYRGRYLGREAFKEELKALGFKGAGEEKADKPEQNPDPSSTPNPDPNSASNPDPSSTSTPDPSSASNPDPSSTPNPGPGSTPNPGPNSGPTPKMYFEIEVGRELSLKSTVDPMYATERNVVDAIYSGMDVHAEQFAKEMYRNLDFRTAKGYVVCYKDGHSVTYNMKEDELQDEGGDPLTKSDVGVGYYAEDKIYPLAEYKKVLSRFGITGKDVHDIYTTSDGGVIFKTTNCDIQISADRKTVTLRDSTGLWQEAEFVFDDKGNVSATYSGKEVNGQKEELVLSCKNGGHLEEFLKEARKMLEDRTDMSAKQRADLLYKLLVEDNGGGTFTQRQDVVLHSISNLELKNLHFLDGYHFDGLKIDNCSFTDCVFDVSGNVIATGSKFTGGVIHGNSGTPGNATHLSFLGIGIESKGLQITGNLSDSAFLIKDKSSASNIIAHKIEGELPVFLPEGAEFQYTEKDKTTIGTHSVAQELRDHGFAALQKIKSDARFMTADSKAALSKSIKNELKGLVFANNDENKDVFYQLLKKNSADFGGNLATVLDRNFDPTELFRIKGMLSNVYTAGTNSVVDDFIAKNHGVSVYEVPGTAALFYYDDQTKKLRHPEVTKGAFGIRKKNTLVDATEDEIKDVLSLNGLGDFALVC